MSESELKQRIKELEDELGEVCRTFKLHSYPDWDYAYIQKGSPEYGVCVCEAQWLDDLEELDQ